MTRYVLAVFSAVVLAMIASMIGAPSVATAHNVCSLSQASEISCGYSVPPKPGHPASSRRWYTSSEHTPGYADRVWYSYDPPCTRGACILPAPFGACAAYQYTPTPRAFAGSNDIAGPTPGKFRLYCGQGTSSPVPHLHYLEGGS